MDSTSVGYLLSVPSDLPHTATGSTRTSEQAVTTALAAHGSPSGVVTVFTGRAAGQLVAAELPTPLPPSITREKGKSPLNRNEKKMKVISVKGRVLEPKGGAITCLASGQFSGLATPVGEEPLIDVAVGDELGTVTVFHGSHIITRASLSGSVTCLAVGDALYAGDGTGHLFCLNPSSSEAPIWTTRVSTKALVSLTLSQFQGRSWMYAIDEDGMLFWVTLAGTVALKSGSSHPPLVCGSHIESPSWDGPIFGGQNGVLYTLKVDRAEGSFEMVELGNVGWRIGSVVKGGGAGELLIGGEWNGYQVWTVSSSASSPEPAMSRNEDVWTDHWPVFFASVAVGENGVVMCGSDDALVIRRPME